MAIIERMLQVLEKKRYPVSRYERNTGISQGYFKKAKGEPNSDKIIQLKAIFPEVNLEWLITGKGSMFLPTDTSVSVNGDNNQTSNNNGGTTTINNYKNCDSCEKSGQSYYNIDFIEDFSIYDEDMARKPDGYISAPGINNPNTIWCNVLGRAMEPDIKSGDIIAIREIKDWRSYIPMGRVYGVITISGMRTIKTIRKGKDDETLSLIPSNPDFDIEVIPKSAIRSIYVVSGVFRRLS